MLTEVAGQRVVPTGVEVTARFTDGAITGSAGCNRYRGAYQLHGEALRLDAGATTKACPPAAAVCVNRPTVGPGQS